MQSINQNIGWGKAIISTLNENKLPTDLQAIRGQRKNEWKRNVQKSIETRNRERLLKELHKVENGVEKPKTKTASIIDSIKDPAYQPSPQTIIMRMSKRETKTLITSRFHMLECGVNFKGTKSVTCNTCNLPDDEHHRLNYCIKYRALNHYDDSAKVNFRDIFSDDSAVVRNILTEVTKVWNLCNANGTMNTI